ncbi:protein CURLY FLAG LEAF 1-like [Diospyros lotus]|uniref:protein CURLY FLAG LEAF 1-like n=1 Tax=Diospyros lotus TaxID=55363 RepID=UPI0022556351|nr:protein CURLY FLAG LEAF 1-like [Diospyros lotus]
MKAPDMEAITGSLERSLRNFSLNQSSGSPAGEDAGIVISASSDDSPENHYSSLGDATLELNSHISLPYHWEQCLDLKTGEIYYINWRSGMSAKERPPAMAELYLSEDDSSYDSEGSSSVPAPESESKSGNQQHNEQQERQVLVVAGCKRCLMYLMVPKQLGDCPKCCGRLLRFDPSQDVSPSP